MVWSAIASVWTGGKAAEASRDAARTSADAQRESQRYLEESQAVPMHYRDQALAALAQEFGLPVPDGYEAPLIPGGITEMAKRSPIYDAIMSTRGAGEESLARNMGASGRLRGGAGIDALNRYNTDLESQAIMSAYENIMQGLGSFTGYQGFAPQIAQSISGQGATIASGDIAAARAKQEGYSGAIQGLQGQAGFLTGMPI